jgi:anthranilate phosphoribosyltransferase
VGIARAPREYIRGGTKEENAAILELVLRGEQGPKRDVVLLNTAAALLAADAVRSLKDGVALAERSLDSGAALAALNGLRALSHKLAAVAS